MPSATRLLAVAFAALAACGNYSTEDVAFIEAVPTRAALRVELPGPQPAAPCGALGEATGWVEGHRVGVGMNAGLDWILRVVDMVRSADPTRRERDRRTWGPFADGRHPGIQHRIVLGRSFDGAGTPTYRFSFEAWSQATGWLPLIEADFVGASAQTGTGTIWLRFGNIRSLGLNEQPTDPQGDIAVGYDRRSAPWMISLTIAPSDSGFGLVDYPYTYWSWPEGDGRFDYAVRDATGNKIEWHARFTPEGAGRGEVTIFPALPPPLSYALSACWDAAGCYSAVNDPFNAAGLCASAPCVTPAWPQGCPAVRP